MAYTRLISRVLCIILLMASMAGCGKHHPAHKNTVSVAKAEPHQETVLQTDSFKYALKTPNGSCDVYIDYPKSGPKTAVESLRAFIRSTLFEDGGDTIADDPSEWVRQYCVIRQQHLKKTLSEMGLTQISETYAPEEGIDIRLTCQTDRMVTYEIYRYSYISHGAHGEYSDYGVTFRLSDGQRLSHILDHVDEALYAHIRVGLREYFGVSTDEALDKLCTADLSLLPMPTFPPYLMKDGVRLHFSIYDICAFDDGDPEVTIPYDIAWPYMTEEAREAVLGIKD